MAIISKETFEKFSEEEKKKIRQIYKDMKEEPSLAYAHEYAEKCEWLEDYFGKENLQPKIKTWEDVEEEYAICKEDISVLENLCYCEHKIIQKLIATYKISKLIGVGYGGLPTKKEYEEDGAWQIIPHRETYDEKFKFKIVMDFQYKSFISFHNEEQAKEFMSYPENVELIEQYFML